MTVERVVRDNRGAVHASSAELMDDMILDDLSRGQRTLILILILIRISFDPRANQADYSG